MPVQYQTAFQSQAQQVLSIVCFVTSGIPNVWIAKKFLTSLLTFFIWPFLSLGHLLGYARSLHTLRALPYFYYEVII